MTVYQQSLYDMRDMAVCVQSTAALTLGVSMPQEIQVKLGKATCAASHLQLLAIPGVCGILCPFLTASCLDTLQDSAYADLIATVVALVTSSACCLIDSQSLHLCEGQVRGKDAADVVTTQGSSPCQVGKLGARVCAVG